MNPKEHTMTATTVNTEPAVTLLRRLRNEAIAEMVELGGGSSFDAALQRANEITNALHALGVTDL